MLNIHLYIILLSETMVAMHITNAFLSFSQGRVVFQTSFNSLYYFKSGAEPEILTSGGK